MFALNIRFLTYNLLLIVVNDGKSYININTIYLMIQTVCFVLTERAPNLPKYTNTWSSLEENLVNTIEVYRRTRKISFIIVTLQDEANGASLSIW